MTKFKNKQVIFMTNPSDYLPLGSYDEFKNEYNLTLTQKAHYSNPLPDDQVTVSWNEKSKGWVSFKTFRPASTLGLQGGISLNNKYFTFFD